MDVIQGVFKQTGQPDALLPIACDADGRMLNVGGATVVSTTVTRPADTNVYAFGDLVANNTVVGSVVYPYVTAGRTGLGVSSLTRVRMSKTSSNISNAAFRIHIYANQPTGLANGDNGVFQTNVNNYVGRADIVMDTSFANGAWGSTDLSFAPFMVATPANARMYFLIEARNAYTPISGEVFTLVFDLVQD